LHDRVTVLLRLLEDELRAQDRWDPAPPDAEALRSSVPFAADVLSFDQWLQWILLPRFQALLDLGAALPTRCAIRPMAEEVYDDEDLPAQRIVGLLGELDRVLEEQNGE
jgi:uncharacterized protein YqcC (DUF446 family)